MPDWSAKADRRSRLRLKSERGVALVEFALVLPLVMLLLLGLVDFGKAFTMWIDETHLASAAARYAAVDKYNGAAIDVGGNPTVADFEHAMELDGDTKELRDSFADPSHPGNGVHICFPAPTGQLGDSIRVDVRATYHFLDFLSGLVPSLSGDKSLTAHSTQRIEKNPGWDNAVVASHACTP